MKRKAGERHAMGMMETRSVQWGASGTGKGKGGKEREMERTKERETERGQQEIRRVA